MQPSRFPHAAARSRPSPTGQPSSITYRQGGETQKKAHPCNGGGIRGPHPSTRTAGVERNPAGPATLSPFAPNFAYLLDNLGRKHPLPLFVSEEGSLPPRLLVGQKVRRAVPGVFFGPWGFLPAKKNLRSQKLQQVGKAQHEGIMNSFSQRGVNFQAASKNPMIP